MKNTHPPFIIIPFEIMTDDRLTLRHIKVLMAIFSWRKSNTNIARMSRQMISDRTGYPLTRISAITTELVKLGWLKKSGNLGKKQWSEYEIQDLDFKKNNLPTPVTDSVTTPVTDSVTTPVTDSVTTPVTDSVTSIDTEVIDTEVIDTEVIDTKKVTKKISYEEKVENFIPTPATANAFKKIYPLLGKDDFIELIVQFKDQALNRDKNFKCLDAGMRNYLKRKYIKPVKQVVRKNEVSSYRDIGDTVRIGQEDNLGTNLPKQILIDNKG